MPSAIILLSTIDGTENAILRRLRMLECVTEAYAVQSAYDIIVKVTAETFDKLSTVISNIKSFSHNPLSIVTMLVVEASTIH